MTAELFKALAAAQAEFTTPRKTRKANYGYYADLAEIFASVRPALNRHGLCVYQSVMSDPDRGGVSVETVIAHESGESISSGRLWMPCVQTKGGNAAQAFGSAETYARRYSLTAFLGLAADDDDDGQSAETAPAKAPRPRMTEEEKEVWRNAAREGRQTMIDFYNSRSEADRRRFNEEPGLKDECVRIYKEVKNEQ